MKHPADIDRFWSKIQMTNNCWIWTAGKVQNKYGAFQLGSSKKSIVKRAHILVYEILVGKIPDGLVLDHLCRNTACVNPAHLEPVTDAENVRRGDSWKYNRLKTHCPQGHEYTPENTARYTNARNSGLARRCLICKRDAGRLYQKTRKHNATA